MIDLSRSELLIGKDAIEKLRDSRVLLLGLGGVGSYCLEALVRAGIGEIHIVDGDVVEASNVNRQLFAVSGNYGKPKVRAALERITFINPDCKAFGYETFLTLDNLEELPLERMNYVADAIDTVSVKIRLAEICFHKNIELISAMGAGNKLDPTGFKVADVFQTDVCPLAKVMRHELRLRGVRSLKVVYTNEKPVVSINRRENHEKKQTPSISFVPPVVGFIMAGQIIKDLIGSSEIINKKDEI